MTGWYYSVDGVQYGPVSTDDLRRFLAEKRLTTDDFVWHPAMPAWSRANEVAELVGEAPLFAAAVPKLVLMTIATFGAYEVYWGYKHWKILEPRLNEPILPFWRGVFGVFFLYALTREINIAGKARGIEKPLPAEVLAVLFFLLNLSVRLPDPYWLVAFLAVVPIAVVQRRANRVNAQEAPLSDRNSRIRGWNWLAVLIGLPLFVMAVIGTFLEG